jgi:hypothetical protein
MKLIFALALPLCADARDSLSFDFGWKFRTGLTQKAGPNDQPPQHP